MYFSKLLAKIKDPEEEDIYLNEEGYFIDNKTFPKFQLGVIEKKSEPRKDISVNSEVAWNDKHPVIDLDSSMEMEMGDINQKNTMHTEKMPNGNYEFSDQATLIKELIYLASRRPQIVQEIEIIDKSYDEIDSLIQMEETNILI